MFKFDVENFLIISGYSPGVSAFVKSVIAFDKFFECEKTFIVIGNLFVHFQCFFEHGCTRCVVFGPIEDGSGDDLFGLFELFIGCFLLDTHFVCYFN